MSRLPFQPRPAPVRQTITSGEGERLIAELGARMDSLLAIIERETELVRAGKLRAAAEVAREKADISGAYMAAAERVKTNAALLSAHARAALDSLRKRHEAMQAQLQMNLTVLATAHAVSEGIVRGVAGEVARKSAPQTYGNCGRANVPARAAQPIAVSRTL